MTPPTPLAAGRINPVELNRGLLTTETLGRLTSLRRAAKSCGTAEDSARGQKGVPKRSENAAGGTENLPPPGPGRAGSRRWVDGDEPPRTRRRGW